MKKLLAYLIVLACGFSRLSAAQEPPNKDNVYYADEDEEFFNRGKLVGKEPDDYLRSQRRARNKNWAIAVGTSLVGIVTLVMVGKNS